MLPNRKDAAILVSESSPLPLNDGCAHRFPERALPKLVPRLEGAESCCPQHPHKPNRRAPTCGEA